jgi:mono/diheme cytochrome c family protein
MPRDEAREWLIEKVKKGGSGSWNSITGGAEMPPQGRIVSEQHIEVLVDFILSLKRDENAKGEALDTNS